MAPKSPGSRHVAGLSRQSQPLRVARLTDRTWTDWTLRSFAAHARSRGRPGGLSSAGCHIERTAKLIITHEVFVRGPTESRVGVQ